MVTLRSFKPSDINGLIKYLNDSQVTQYITQAIASPYTEEDAIWWVNQSVNSPYIKAIDFNGEFVGCISAVCGNFEYSRSAELGYWIGKPFWNQGIATQAIAQFTHLLFDSTDLVRLFGSVVTQNIASIRVLAKNNFIAEGVLKSASFKNQQFYDEQILAKLNVNS